MKLNNKKWQDLLADLKDGRISDDQIGSTIVRLAKPLDRDRVLSAKDTIIPYLEHPNTWARHEAMWFLRWAKLVDHKQALIHALQNDPDVDNRSYAALCLSNLLPGTSDHDSIQALKVKVLDSSEDEHVRLDSYGALLEIAENRSGGDFFSGSANLENIDWNWVHTLG